MSLDIFSYSPPRRLNPLLAAFVLFGFLASPISAQLHAFPHLSLDSLDAKVKRDSLLAKTDSAKAASDSLAGDDTVTYSGARIRYRTDRFSLSEKALLTYRGSSLTADSIVFYSQDDVVEAMGAPLIQDPANPPILGYRMRYNLKTKVGEIYYGSSKKGNQTFNGVEVRRQKNGDVYIARGDFSTCDSLDKHYYFYSRRMIMEPKSKVLSGPIVMNIGDVPVAILPMMVMPLGSGRRSGILQPKFGGDQSQGFYLMGLGYYWAFNDYTDLMVSGDLIEGQSGTFDKTNLNSTFRYNQRYQYSGSLGGKLYVNEFDPSNAGWMVDYAHDQNVTPDGKQTLKGTGRFQSDPTIVDRNALTESERVKQTANATLGYRRQFDWNQATLNVNLSQDYNLTDSLIDRNIPDLSFRVGGPLFPAPDDADMGPIRSEEDPWYRKINWSYDNRANVNDVSRPRNTSFRGDSNTYVGYQDHLGISGKYPLLKYFNLTPSVNFGEMWSLQKKGDSLNPVQVAWDPANNQFGEYFPNFSTGLSLDTRIYGIAQAENKPWFGTLLGIRHTITPTMGFTYAPKIDSNPEFLPNPKIGGVAFQARQKTVNFGLGNDIDLKLVPEDLSASTAATANAAYNANAGSAQPGNTPNAPGNQIVGIGSGPTGAVGSSSGLPGGSPVTPNGATKKGESYKVLSASSSASYNFAKDTREWSDIPSTFNVYLTKNVALTLSATHALYDDFAGDGQVDRLTFPILTSYGFGWRKGLAIAGDFNSGVRVRDTRGFPTDHFEHTPWSADVNYSFDFTSRRVAGGDGDDFSRLIGTTGTFQRTRTHQAYGSLRLNPTAGWQMTYDTDYNFSDGRFSKHSFSFHRTLHCWEMDFHWTPVGISEGWNFNIRITDLPDVKLESSDSKQRRLGP